MLQSHSVIISLIPGAAPHVKNPSSLSSAVKSLGQPCNDQRHSGNVSWGFGWICYICPHHMSACTYDAISLQSSPTIFWKSQLFDLFFLFPSVVAVKSKTGALEGPEVDGFVKDMMGLVRVSSLFWETTVCLLHVKVGYFTSPPAQHDRIWAGPAPSRYVAPLWRQQRREDPEKRARSVPGSQTITSVCGAVDKMAQSKYWS